MEFFRYALGADRPGRCYRRWVMRNRPSTLTRGALVLAALLPCACASSPGTISFPLVYSPSEKPELENKDALAPVPVGALIFIAQIVDQRQMQDPHVLGVSQEADPDAAVYNAAGGQVPTEFVRNVLAKELAALGMPVTADPNIASHTLQIQLDQFWVVEGSTFQATVGGQAWLIDRGGVTRWQGSVAGKNSRWGRSHETGNFLQTFSDATMEVAEKLASNNDFRVALGTP